MTTAKSLALRQMAYAGGGLLLPFVVPTLVGSALGRENAAVAVAGVLALIVGAVTFFYFFFWWRPACPGCGVGRARFVRADREERLRCAQCGYDEPTGRVYD